MNVDSCWIYTSATDGWNVLASQEEVLAAVGSALTTGDAVVRFRRADTAAEMYVVIFVAHIQAIT